MSTASHAAELEAQFRKVSQELAEYKAESTQIKNQVCGREGLGDIRSCGATME